MFERYLDGIYLEVTAIWGEDGVGEIVSGTYRGLLR
jgi:hypothetical protein